MYLGIDVGSVSTDGVLLDRNFNITGYAIVKSGFDHEYAVRVCIDEVCRIAGICRNDIKKVVGTGYGRRNVATACRTVTEISCHAMGIHLLFPTVRTVIDVGGQDSKVIRVSEGGFVDTFMMNDKCAAGTGRFLEVMAQAMGVEVHELGELSMKAGKVQPISSICTVFAESEVISKISEGCAKEEIIAGIHKAIGERVLGLATAVGIQSPVAFTGGVAKNRGVVKAVSNYIEEELFIPDEPQIIGALGAAAYARNIDDRS